MLPVVDAPIACSLGNADLDNRINDWRRLFADVQSVERPQPGTVVMHLSPQMPVGELASLCEQEVECCPFFAFGLHIAAGAVSLTVRVPEDAASTLVSLERLLPTGVQADAR